MGVGSGVRDVVHTLSANVFVLLLNIVTGVITARFLGPEGRGEMAAVIYWPQLMAYLVTLGLPAALIFYLRRDPGRANRIVGSALLSGAILGVASSVAGILAIPWVLGSYPDHIIKFAQYAMAFTPLALVSLLLVSVAQSQPTLKVYNLARIGGPALTSVFLLFLLATIGLSAENAAMCYFVSGAVVGLFLILWATRKFRPVFQGLKKTIEGLLHYGIRSYGSDLVAVLMLYIDRMVVLYFLDSRGMGLYVVALGLAQVLNVIPHGVSAVLFPRASGGGKENVLQMGGKALRLGLLALFAAGIPLLLGGPYALGVFYGKEFFPASAILQMLILYVLIGGLAQILEQIYMALGMPGRVSFFQVVVFLSGFPVMIFSIKYFGLEGVGYGLVFMATLRFLIAYFYVYRSTGLPAPTLLPNLIETKDFLINIRYLLLGLKKPVRKQ